MKRKIKTIAAVICMAALLMPVGQTTEVKAAKQEKVTVFAKKRAKKSKKKQAYKGIVNLTSKNFEKEVLKAKGKVIIDIGAKWCYYCQLLEPLYKKAAEKLPQYKFTKIDADAEEELVEALEITGFPTMIIVEDGEVKDVGSYIKDMTTDDLVSWIKGK